MVKLKPKRETQQMWVHTLFEVEWIGTTPKFRQIKSFTKWEDVKPKKKVRKLEIKRGGPIEL